LRLLLAVGGASRVFPGVRPASGLWSVAVEGSRGHQGASIAKAPPPVISISIEPAVLAPYAEAESPVVFPGYLLPDDGCEEPAHAGS
jgi:hypothetical protein